MKFSALSLMKTRESEENINRKALFVRIIEHLLKSIK